jgi:hypothetical protein
VIDLALTRALAVLLAQRHKRTVTALMNDDPHSQSKDSVTDWCQPPETFDLQKKRQPTRPVSSGRLASLPAIS